MERVRNGVLLRALAALLAAGFAAGIEAQRGTTERVSVDSFGREGNSHSSDSSISGDGRFVAFYSSATNLVPNDTNSVLDVFVHDRQTGQTTRVSVSSSGEQGNNGSRYASISADGRFVAFSSTASNLVPNDTNRAQDVFVHDRQTGQTTRVSVSSSGQQGNGDSHAFSISADGRFVAFSSRSWNLVPNDTNVTYDVFVHDRQTGQTTRVSVSSSGQQGNGESSAPSISADGRFVAFGSSASNLVPNDTNNEDDVFVHDRQTGQTTRVSVSSSGQEGNDHSAEPSISGDGRFVAFTSWASNLVPNDTNGTYDVFVHDRHTAQTSRVSVSSSGQQGNSGSSRPAISADGRFVAFDSYASNLVPNDTNIYLDVFVHDRQSGQTTRVSVSSSGEQGNNWSLYPSISADGRFVAFRSHASNLVPNDTNWQPDVFVHQYGPGEGWGGGGGWESEGNTDGDRNLRRRQQPRDPNLPAPIVLVNGLRPDDAVMQFFGGTQGHTQWDTFKQNFVQQYASRGYSVYDPNTNPNGNIFICDTLNTVLPALVNAALLNTYLEGVANAPAFVGNSDFDIVGYSFGGIVARVWERAYDAPFGPNRERYNVTGKRLRNIVTVATPHAGSEVADLFCRRFGCAGIPSVLEMTTWWRRVSNRVSPGLPGTRYSHLAGDLDVFIPLFGTRHHDLVVRTNSALDARWHGEGTTGRLFVNELEHFDVPWNRWVGILDDPVTATNVYDAIYGAGPGASIQRTYEPAHREALSARSVLLRGERKEFGVPISPGAFGASFSAHWEQGTAQLTLIEPGGRVIDPQTAKNDPNIEYDEHGIVQAYTISRPVEGSWLVRVDGGSDLPKEGVLLDVSATDDAPVFSDGEAPVLTRFGSPLRFKVWMRDGAELYAGGAVSATLLHPDETTAPLRFYDDGLHGDGAPNDGVWGSDEVVGKQAGGYVAFGQVVGVGRFGTVARTFTIGASVSNGAARIGAIQQIRPTDDPSDGDDYYDVLNVDVRVSVAAAGTYSLSADLVDQYGSVFASATETWTAGAPGAFDVTLSFVGACIGEHDVSGPWQIRGVTLLDHSGSIPLMSDHVELLGTTDPYDKLLFETITPRTVAPVGFLQPGLNLISLPLDPVAPYNAGIESILGPGASLVGKPPFSPLRRGEAYWVQLSDLPVGSVSYLGLQEEYEFPVELEGPTEYLIGCPYNRPLPLSRVLVFNRDTGQYRTAEQDAKSGAPWVNWTWQYYEGGVWKRLMLSGGDDDHLRPWYGYKVTTNVPNVTLILRD